MDEKTKEKIARWRRENPEKVAETQRKYRARKKAEKQKADEEAALKQHRINLVMSTLEYKVAVTRILQYVLEVLEETHMVPITEVEMKEIKSRLSPYIINETRVPDELLKKYPRIETFLDRLLQDVHQV